MYMFGSYVSLGYLSKEADIDFVCHAPSLGLDPEQKTQQELVIQIGRAVRKLVRKKVHHPFKVTTVDQARVPVLRMAVGKVEKSSQMQTVMVQSDKPVSADELKQELAANGCNVDLVQTE
eukprot:gene6094-16074_t